MRLGLAHNLFSRFIHMKWLLRIATLESSLLMAPFLLELKPSIENTAKELLDIKPRAPTSIVLEIAENPFDLASSTRSKYFCLFLSFQSWMFSSAGEVSSMKHTFLACSLNMQISGRRLVLAIEGGTWYCFCRVSTSTFQSVAVPQYDLTVFFFFFIFSPDLTNLIELESSSLDVEDFLVLIRLTLILFTIHPNTESCLKLILPCSSATLHQHKMCWRLQFL